MNADLVNHLINNLAEGLSVEVKNWLNNLSSPDEKSKLAKEIIALANSGGGHIFIGFSDVGEDHPAEENDQFDARNWSQDSLASLVAKYIDPPIQIDVGLFSKQEGSQKHPVIEVPGGHRTPIYAKKGSPNNKSLIPGQIYLRRPGGASEPARTQDDWEKLIDRLVRARLVDQIDAIREVINPSVAEVSEQPDLSEWQASTIERWQNKSPYGNGCGAGVLVTPEGVKAFGDRHVDASHQGAA